MYRQEGARLARPARARARRDARRSADWQDTKRDTGGIDWKRPDGDAVHADGRRRAQRRGATSRTLPGAPDHRPRSPRCPPATTCGGRAPATTSGARRTAGHNLDLCAARLAPCRHGTNADADASSRAGTSSGTSTTASSCSTDGQRQDLHVATPRPRATRRAAAQNPNANGCQTQYGNGLTGYERVLRRPARRPSTGVARQLPDGGVRRRRVRHLRPDRQAGRPCCASLRDRPGPGAAGLVHGRRDDQGRRQRHLRRRTSRRARMTRRCLQRRLPRERSPPRSSCTNGWQLRRGRRRTRPAEHAYLHGDARPLRLRRHGQGESDRGDARRGPPASCSPTRTRTTATATSAPTTRRRRAPLDARPEPEQRHAEPRRRGVQGAGDAFSDVGAGHTDNYDATRARRPRRGCSKYGCLSFTVDRLAGAGDRAGGRGRATTWPAT